MKNQRQLSLDDQAAALAKQLMKSNAAGDMPEGQLGAEGGLSDDADGKLMLDSAKKMEKGEAKTGERSSDEPKREGKEALTDGKVTKEPKRDEADGGAGEGGNLSQDEDEKLRARKESYSEGPGQGGNLDQDADEMLRGRKDGKVGIAKSDSDDEEDKEEDKEDKDMEKSEDIVSADALLKSLELLEEAAQLTKVEAPETLRKSELVGKLSSGESLSKSEWDELQLLSVEETKEETVVKSFQGDFADDDEMKKHYDVSSFLERQSQLVAASLDDIQENFQKSLSSQQTHRAKFDTQLAKSLHGMATMLKGQDELIKSQSEMITGLQERLENVENQPLPRRSVGNVGVLKKGGFGWNEEPQLSGQQLGDALVEMAQRHEFSPSGVNLMNAVAEFEHSGRITKSLHNEVHDFINKRRAA